MGCQKECHNTQPSILQNITMMLGSAYHAPEVDRTMDAPEVYHAQYDGQAPQVLYKGDIYCYQLANIPNASDRIQHMPMTST